MKNQNITSAEAAIAVIEAANSAAEARIRNGSKSSRTGFVLALLLGPLAYLYTRQIGKLALAVLTCALVPVAALPIYILAVLDNGFFAAPQWNKKLREENPIVKI